MKLPSDWFLLLLLVPGSYSCAQYTATRANIIYILADGSGIGDISCYGSDTNCTPIMDKLAN